MTSWHRSLRSDFSVSRGASPLGLPDTLSRAPLRRRAPFAWLARCRSLAPGTSREYLADLHERPPERVQFLAGVVHREGRARRPRNLEAIHHRLRAVMAGPDRDTFLIEDRADVVGVHAVHDERQDAGLLARSPDEPHAADRLQHAGRVGPPVARRRAALLEPP